MVNTEAQSHDVLVSAVNSIVKGEKIDFYPDFVAMAKVVIDHSAFYELPQTLEIIYDAANKAQENGQRQPAAIRREAKRLLQCVKNDAARGYLQRFVRGEDAYKVFDDFATFVWDLTLKVSGKYHDMYWDNQVNTKHLISKAA